MALSHIYCIKFSFETFDVISVWLLLCYKSFEYCVCQHYRSRDDTEAQRLDHLRSGRYKMVSEHMLTVGRDPRNWQAHSKDFSLQLSLSKRSFTSLLFWAYSKIPFSETIHLSPFDHTKIRLMRPLQEVQDIGQLRPFGMKRTLPCIMIMETTTVEDSEY